MRQDLHHLLLITTDQQRFDTIQAGGNRHILTPHLNWLLETGVQFTRCYADSPICGPSRMTIMTGRHAFTNGAVTNSTALAQEPLIDAATSLPGWLTRRGGYQSRAVGKMHFAPERCHNGFEHMEILEDYYREMRRHPERGVPANHGLGQNEMQVGFSTVAETHTLTHWIIDRSVDFLETRDPTRPYFLWTSFSKPHPPYDPCWSYWELYRDKPLPPPILGDWSTIATDVPPGFMFATWQQNGCDTFTEEQLRDCKRAYYACITQVDYNLGILFARLRELGLLDQTTIIFTSDHGDMLGDHHMGHKSHFLEGSAHVPLLVRPAKGVLPESARGTKCDELVCLADLLPTFAALAGLPAPQARPLDGLNLLDVLAARTHRERLHGQCGPWHAVIERDCKYMFTELGASELLFNLTRDPLEQHELIRAGKDLASAKRLRGELHKRLSKSGHPAAGADDQLIATRAAPERTHARANPWPGFHRQAPPWEVMH